MFHRISFPVPFDCCSRDDPGDAVDADSAQTQPINAARFRQTAIRLVLLFSVAYVLIGDSVVANPVAAEPVMSSAQQLADRYAPVVYLRKQTKACATPPDGGEPYVPSPVEIVFANQGVLLKENGDGPAANDPVLITDPSATDLAGQSEDTYLDFPGNSRSPGCTYERDSRRVMNALNAQPTTYAHIVEYPEDNHLVVQFWLYYYFNQWNNLHESDWEMIQVIWDNAGTVEQALLTEPDGVGYAQHEGGELADWGDDKLSLENGTHPVVYPAAGSHASFFGSNIYLGWGENGTGFGCDEASPPSVRTPLNAVVIPNDPDPNGPFAWVLFPGRWGQRQPSFFNGPRGPMFGPKWDDPWAVAQDWRDSSLVVPGSNSSGPSATGLFCSLTSMSSSVLVVFYSEPWVTGGAIAAILLAVLYFALAARAAFAEAFAVYRANWRVFAGIGLLAIPIGWLFNIVQLFVVDHGPLGWAVDWFNDTAEANLWAVSLLGGIQQIATMVAILPAVIQAITDIRAGVQPGIVRSYRLAFAHAAPLSGATGLFLLAIGASVLVIIGLPVAIWLSIRWQFFGQALLIGKAGSSRAALSESSRTVGGHWWRTLATSLVFHLLAVGACPLVGLLLLIFGKAAIGLANGVTSFIYALTIPILGIALTILYLNQRADSRQEPSRQPIAVRSTK